MFVSHSSSRSLAPCSRDRKLGIRCLPLSFFSGRLRLSSQDMFSWSGGVVANRCAFAVPFSFVGVVDRLRVCVCLLKDVAHSLLCPSRQRLTCPRENNRAQLRCSDCSDVTHSRAYRHGNRQEHKHTKGATETHGKEHNEVTCPIAKKSRKTTFVCATKSTNGEPFNMQRQLVFCRPVRLCLDTSGYATMRTMSYQQTFDASCFSLQCGCGKHQQNIPPPKTKRSSS